jgi:hypothetical protein
MTGSTYPNLPGIPVPGGPVASAWAQEISARVDFLNHNVLWGMQGGQPNITTDGVGDARITFPVPYAAIPGVAVAANNLANVQFVIHSVDTTGFSVRAFFWTPGGTPNDPWTGTTAIGWVSSGAMIGAWP